MLNLESASPNHTHYAKSDATPNKKTPPAKISSGKLRAKFEGTPYSHDGRIKSGDGGSMAACHGFFWCDVEIQTHYNSDDE